MTVIVRDLLILIVGAGAPAGLALLLTWRKLVAPKSFWMGVALGEMGLFVLAFLGTWIAIMIAEANYKACRELAAGAKVDCGQPGEFVLMVGMPLWLSVAAFLIAAFTARAIAFRRPKGTGNA